VAASCEFRAAFWRLRLFFALRPSSVELMLLLGQRAGLVKRPHTWKVLPGVRDIGSRLTFFAQRRGEFLPFLGFCPVLPKAHHPSAQPFSHFSYPRYHDLSLLAVRFFSPRKLGFSLPHFHKFSEDFSFPNPSGILGQVSWSHTGSFFFFILPNCFPPREM